MATRAVVFGAARDGQRTARALRQLGLDTALVDGPTWFVRAGAWPVARSFEASRPSTAGDTPWLVIGGARGADGQVSEDAVRLEDALARTHNDLAPLAHARALPPLASVFADARATAMIAARCAAGASIEQALIGAAESGKCRFATHRDLDVRLDARLRVLVVLSSLQQGGAERVALDLVTALPAHGVFAGLATTGRPLRAAFPAPAVALDFSGAGATAEARAARIADAAIAGGFDLVHAHLLGADEIRAIGARLPVVTTAHNTREAWPRGFADLDARHVALVIACSRAVERDLAEVGPRAPRRTIWNGVDPAPFRAISPADHARVRRELGLAADDLVLLAVANPRPQKRLDRLPGVLATIQARGRRAKLVIVGDSDPKTREGSAAARELDEAIARAGVGGDVRRTGSREDVAAVLAASDVLVSTSAHEGLSMAQLEALAAGLPVVSTDVGGAREVGGALCLVDVDATDAAFADAILAVEKRRTELPPAFTRDAMAARHAQVYRRALRGRQPGGHGRADGPSGGGGESGSGSGSGARGEGLVLVTNNLATGGAQTSARRLLLELARRGVRVRAAVLEEQVGFPTPGRRALVAAGVPVAALPGLEDGGRTAAARLVAEIDGDRPRAVVFWNALAQVKVRVADALLDVPVFDVSPGEMWFSSLERFFEEPPYDLPYDARAYVERLAGVVVKYAAEVPRAAALGARVTVVRNGVDLRPRRAGRASDGAVRVGTVARISPQKKLEELFDALRLAAPRLPPWELVVAGGAERGTEAYADALRASVSDLPVRFLGDVDARALHAELDVFAAISEPAGCPNASLEALASGLAVVATDVGGASEQIVDGVTGLLVPRRDPRALGGALVALAESPELRARLGAAGRDHAATEFSVERMIAGYLSVFSLEGEEPPPGSTSWTLC